MKRLVSYFIFFFLFSIYPMFALEHLSFNDFIREFYQSNEHKKYDYPMLTYAISKNYRDIAFHLLARGDNPNLMPKNSYSSSLCQAIFHEDVEMVEYLLDNGAWVNKWVGSLRTESGYSTHRCNPLLQALWTNKNIQISRLLLERGADSRWDTSSSGDDPFYPVVLRGEFEKFWLLVDYGADFFKWRENWMLALCGERNHDLRASKMELVHYLLNSGVEVDFPDSTFPSSPLGRAAASFWPELVTLLISRGADVNHRAPTVSSPPSPPDKYRSVLGGAVYSCAGVDHKPQEILKTIQILIDSGSEINHFDWFYIWDDPRFPNFQGLKWIWDEQYSSFDKGKHLEGTNLFMAMICKNYDVAKLLVLNGAQLEGKPLKELRYTYLQLMIKNRDEDGAIFLIENGADPENTGSMNIHPLDLAISNGLHRTSEALIKVIAKKYQ